jgi:hypothetical protein
MSKRPLPWGKKERRISFAVCHECASASLPQNYSIPEHKMCPVKIFRLLNCEALGAFTFTMVTFPFLYSFSSSCRYMVAAVIVAAVAGAAATEDDAEGVAVGAAANAAAATAEKSYDDTEDDAEGDGGMGGAFRGSTYMLLAVNLGTTPHRLDKSPDLDRSSCRSDKALGSPNKIKSFFIPTTVASRIPVTFRSLAPSPVFNAVIEKEMRSFGCV